MDESLLIAAAGVAVAVVAIATSLAIGVRQLRVAARQVEVAAAQVDVAAQTVQLGPVIEMLSEFRKESFYNDYRHIIDALPAKDPSRGLSGLDERDRRAVLNVGHHYQNFAGLAVMGLLPEQLVLSILRRRLTTTWDALEQFVVAERLRRPAGESDLFVILQVMAERAAQLPEDALQTYIAGSLSTRP